MFNCLGILTPVSSDFSSAYDAEGNLCAVELWCFWRWSDQSSCWFMVNSCTDRMCRWCSDLSYGGRFSKFFSKQYAKKQQNPHNYKTKTLLFTTILYSVHSISNKHEIFSTATSAPFYPCHYIYMYQIHGSSVLQWGAVLNRCQSRKWLRLRSGCWLKMCDAAGEVSHNRTSLSLELDFQNRAH